MDSKNHTLNGLRGIVIDETKNTVKVEIDGTIRRIIKNHINVLEVTKYNKIIITNGTSIIGRPEDKITK